MTAQQRLHAVGLVIFVVISFGVASIFFRDAGTNLLPGGSKYTVSAIVPTAVALAVDADVREDGVDIGNVDKIAASGPDGSASLVDFHLNSHAPLYRNAQVEIRTKSVAGENYLELTPGTPAAGVLPNGGTLGINQAQDATQIDQILSIFDQARQQDLQRALGGLGSGLQNGGRNLNETLEAASALPDQGSAAAAVLADDKAQFADLVDTLGTVTAALGDRRSAIEELTRQMDTAATAVSERNAKLQAVLDELPPFLTQAQTTARRLENFSDDATPVVSNLRVAADDLVPTVRVLLPAARQGEAVVSHLKSFAIAASPALKELQPFARDATRFVPPLTSLLRGVKPLVTYLSPYLQEISSFFSLDAASLQASDSTGHVGRIILPISTTDLAGVLNAQESAVLQKLLGSFDTVGQNAYPAPGHVAATAPFSGAYTSLQPDPPYTSR